MPSRVEERCAVATCAVAARLARLIWERESCGFWTGYYYTGTYTGTYW
jgi:hypothetical protein